MPPHPRRGPSPPARPPLPGPQGPPPRHRLPVVAPTPPPPRLRPPPAWRLLLPEAPALVAGYGRGTLLTADGEILSLPAPHPHSPPPPRPAPRAGTRRLCA